VVTRDEIAIGFCEVASEACFSVCKNSRTDDLVINNKIGYDKDWKLKTLDPICKDAFLCSVTIDLGEQSSR